MLARGSRLQPLLRTFLRPASTMSYADPSPYVSHLPPLRPFDGWEFFRKMGSPKYHVAPMVDQSELAFRMLCRKHGSTSAYTPMLHSRLFVEEPKYQREQFTTCEGDRPLFTQFCANDPDTLLKAAMIVAPHSDCVDLNLGCPQRIAKRGNYGAFLMDDLPRVEKLVRNLAEKLPIPVTVKIRIFPDLERTLAYAKMVERSGAAMLGVHGRTRDQKDAKNIRADWDMIKAVVEAVSIPVIANGNVRHREDADALMAYTGAAAVMSAIGILENPALFAPGGDLAGPPAAPVPPPDAGARLLVEYCDLVMQYPTPMRMVKAHAHKMIGDWMREFTDLRDQLNKPPSVSVELVRGIAEEMAHRIREAGRDHPIPKKSAREIMREEKEATIAAAKEEQAREEEAVAAIDKRAGGGAANGAGANGAESNGAGANGAESNGAGANGTEGNGAGANGTEGNGAGATVGTRPGGAAEEEEGEAKRAKVEGGV